MARRYEELARRTIHDSFFPVKQSTFRHTKLDGSMSAPVERVVMEVGEVASGLVLKPESRTVVLVEQFRFPILRNDSGWFVEIAGGLVDPGETTLEALEREVLEETGYKITNPRPIRRFYPAPGTIVEHVTLFAAEAAEKIAPGGGTDPGEDIRVIEWTYDRFFKELDAGRVIDAKAIIAGQWLRQNVQ